MNRARFRIRRSVIEGAVRAYEAGNENVLNGLMERASYEERCIINQIAGRRLRGVNGGF